MADDNHGNTPAAWAAVVVALLGFTVAGVGLMLEPVSWVVFAIGAAITAGAALVFAVMARMGLHGSH
ncbi:HGxxPAAW family protein [Nocardioides sp. SYSU D00038]|uniref:HGxxPAAW family protein n=1 Tax=Nocardioides sp. SYSU D00038 TaxID=2812554 RepID=UPI00196796D4|nr:HGxxPAAW family protein [Nocardioides sp. SYSU D00038]